MSETSDSAICWRGSPETRHRPQPSGIHKREWSLAQPTLSKVQPKDSQGAGPSRTEHQHEPILHQTPPMRRPPPAPSPRRPAPLTSHVPPWPLFPAHLPPPTVGMPALSPRSTCSSLEAAYLTLMQARRMPSHTYLTYTPYL